MQKTYNHISVLYTHNITYIYYIRKQLQIISNFFNNRYYLKISKSPILFALINFAKQN